MNKISFTSRPIYDITIKTKKGKCWQNAEATFSELDPKNNDDYDTMKKIAKSWRNSTYGREIVNDFELNRTLGGREFFYGIELKGDEPLHKRILALGDITAIEPVGPYIRYIQSATQLSNKKKQQYKGAGEMLLYGIIKEAKRFNQRNVSLCMTTKSRDFYKHIGYTKYTDNDDNMEDMLVLEKDNFDNFISDIENKHFLEKII